MKNEIVLGVFGAGRIGKLHVENLQKSVDGVCVKSIVDVVLSEETKQWAQKMRIKNISTDEQIIFGDKEIDAIVICSSTNTHIDLIKRAAAAGKHIFCEKPIGSDIAQIKEALEAVKNAEVKLQIGFVRRFDHNHKAVADALRMGAVGKPEIIKITSRDPAPPPIEYVKVSGGLFFDMMIHDFDMARFLAGSEVTEVSAKGTVLVDKAIGEAGDVDTAIVTLEFANGAIGVIDNSRRAPYGYDQRTEVHGELGCIQGENDRPNTTMMSTADGVTLEKPLWFFLERYNQAFIAEMNAFAAAIKEEDEIPVTGLDGLESVRIAMAAKKSLNEKRPVQLTEI